MTEMVGSDHKEPLMIEAYGTCLPMGRAGNVFMKKIQDSRPDSMLLQE